MSRWKPILPGRLRKQAICRVIQIADSITYPLDLTWKWGLERDMPHSFGFGNAGLAVFFCHVGLALENPKYIRRGLKYLKDAIDGARHENISLDFFGGLSGVCWAVRHIASCLNMPLDLEKEFLAKSEADLLRWCRYENPPIELSGGIAGACLYGAEDKSKISAANILSRTTFKLLSRKAESARTGITWPVSESIIAYVRARHAGFNGNVYSTSVGYGAAGIIGALLAVDSTHEYADESRTLISNGILWLLAQRRPKDLPQFPLAVGIDASPFVPRSHGWYLGDPGIVTVLFNAGLILGHDVWRMTALEIGRASATVRKNNNEHDVKMNDYSLCNGSAGRAHLYNRIFQATGDDLFADEARYWFSHLLETMTPSWGTKRLFEGGYSQSFLLGSAGIALALLASAASTEPTWDRALLASCNKKSDYPQTASS